MNQITSLQDDIRHQPLSDEARQYLDCIAARQWGEGYDAGVRGTLIVGAMFGAGLLALAALVGACWFAWEAIWH